MVEFSALSTPHAVPLDAPRPSDSATSAIRVTPAVQGDGLQSDSRGRSAADRTIESRFNGRVAFTAKFGPDPETGLPLRIVRGEDVEAAENVDLIALVDRRIASGLTDGSVIGVQEARDRAVEPPADSEEASEIDLEEPVGASFGASPDGGEAVDDALPADFGFSRPAPSAERGAVLDISI